MNQEMEFKNIVAQYSKVAPEEMNNEMRFREDLGFSSLDFMSFLGELEDTFDLELDESEVLKITTLGEALNLLEELQTENEQLHQQVDLLKKQQTSPNSSQVQEMVSLIAQQKKRIAEQSELIEKLNESDLIVKENEKLKKENSSLQESVRSTKLHSEITVQACKKEYDSKMKKLKEQKEKADNDTRVAQELLKGAQERINAKAYELNLETEMRLKSEYNNQIYAFYSVLIGLLLYGLLTTVFTAVRSNVFRSDFKAFFVVVWQIICVCETNVIELGQVVSQLGNKIPLPIISTIIHYLLLIALIGGITVVLVFLVIKELKKLYKAYKDNYADVKSLTEVLISLAVAVYFAEPIRSVLPINLILLVIIAHGIYISVRFARDNFS